MPRAMWTGTISFGLVNIPVRLFPATRRKDVRFHEIDRVTGQRSITSGFARLGRMWYRGHRWMT